MKGSGARYHTFVYGSLPQWVLDENIGEGDRIEFRQYAGMGRQGKEYRNAVGRVHLLGPHGPVVVLPGDRFGARPTVVTQETFVRVVSRRRAKGNPPKKWRRSTHDAGFSLEWMPISRKDALAAIRVFGGVRVPPPGRETSVGSDQTYRYFVVNRSGKLELQRRERIGFNPRKKRSSGRRVTARGRMGRTIKTAPFAKYAQRADAAEAAFRMTPTQRREAQRRRFKSNPMSKKEFEFMAAYIADLPRTSGDVEAMISLAVAVGRWSNPRFDESRFRARVVQLRGDEPSGIYRYVNRYKKNPLAIYGANPSRVKTVRELGRVVEIRYKRKDDGQFYKHGFKTRPRLLALSDGTIAVRP